MATQHQQAAPAGESGPGGVPDLNNPGRNPDDPTRQSPEHPGRDGSDDSDIGNDGDDGARGQEPPGQGHPRD